MFSARSFRRFARPALVASLVTPLVILGSTQALAAGNTGAGAGPGAPGLQVTTVATCKDGALTIRYTVRNAKGDRQTVSVFNETGSSIGNLPLGPNASMSIDVVPTPTTAFSFATTKPSRKASIGPWNAAAICTGYTAPIVKTFTAAVVGGARPPVGGRSERRSWRSA